MDETCGLAPPWPAPTAHCPLRAEAPAPHAHATEAADATDAAADDLPAWTLGSLRRGELWESTAIPEIRDQAAELATSILARVGAGTREVA